MPSTEKFRDYVLAQFKGELRVTTRKMMGEYILYCKIAVALRWRKADVTCLCRTNCRQQLARAFARRNAPRIACCEKEKVRSFSRRWENDIFQIAQTLFAQFGNRRLPNSLAPEGNASSLHPSPA